MKRPALFLLFLVAFSQYSSATTDEPEIVGEGKAYRSTPQGWEEVKPAPGATADFFVFPGGGGGGGGTQYDYFQGSISFDSYLSDGRPFWVTEGGQFGNFGKDGPGGFDGFGTPGDTGIGIDDFGSTGNFGNKFGIPNSGFPGFGGSPDQFHFFSPQNLWENFEMPSFQTDIRFLYNQFAPQYKQSLESVNPGFDASGLSLSEKNFLNLFEPNVSSIESPLFRPRENVKGQVEMGRVPIPPVHSSDRLGENHGIDFQKFKDFSRQHINQLNQMSSGSAGQANGERIDRDREIMGRSEILLPSSLHFSFSSHQKKTAGSLSSEKLRERSQNLKQELVQSKQSQPTKEISRRMIQSGDDLIDLSEMIAQEGDHNKSAELLKKADNIYEAATEILRFGLGFVPVLGDVVDAGEAITGIEFGTGRALSPAERVVTLAGLIAGSGAAYRAALKSGNETLRQAAHAAKRLEKMGELPGGGRPNWKVHMGRQGKHTPGHNNYQPNRSAWSGGDAQQAILDKAGTGDRILDNKTGAWTGKERVSFDREIGTYKNPADPGRELPTQNAIIVYSKDGAHIYPSKPGNTK